MRRRAYLTTLGMTGMATVSGCMGGEGGDGTNETINLTVASMMPDEDSYINTRFLFGPWVDKVNEKLENHSLEYEFHGTGSIGDPGELFDLAADGVADLVLDGISYYGGRLPLNEVTDIPALWESGPEQARAANLALYEMATPGGSSDLLYEEFQEIGVRPIMPSTAPQYQIITNNGPFHSIDELEGLVVRVGGGTKAQAAERLGMSGTQVASGDIYSAHQQGTVDADMMNIPAPWTNEWWEVMNYMTSNVSMGGFNATWAMGENAFQSYPDEVQQAMEEAGREAVDEYIPSYQDKLESEVYASEHVATEEPIEEDNQYLVYETDAADQINEAIEPVIDSWIEDREGDGQPGGEVVDTFQSLQQDHL